MCLGFEVFYYLPMCVHVFAHLDVCNSFCLSKVENTFLLFLEIAILQVIIFLLLCSNGTESLKYILKHNVDRKAVSCH